MGNYHRDNRTYPNQLQTLEPEILIVEDQTMDILGLYAILGHLGIGTALAFDGQQALETVDIAKFDLVILDWDMPKVTGGEFLQNLERRSLGKNRPMNIIIHSGHPFELIQFASSRNYRVIDIWQKPIRPIEILRRLKSITEQLRETA